MGSITVSFVPNYYRNIFYLIKYKLKKMTYTPNITIGTYRLARGPWQQKKMGIHEIQTQIHDSCSADGKL